MSSLNRGTRVIQAIATIQECGEITGLELADQLGIGKRVAHGTLQRMATRTKAGVKRLHVVRYIFDADGCKRYPRPVYAIGDKPCASKPKADQNARKREYYNRVKGRTLMNSVFNLGKQWRAGT